MDSPVKPADAELERIVREIAEGMRSAENELARRFERGLTLIARRHARPNEARVQDVVQTVLMSTIVRLRDGALRNAGALPAYLHTCIVREVAALYRDKIVSAGSSLAEHQVPEAVATETPESVAARDQLLGNVLRTIDSLAVPRDREVLVRFYVREESRDLICAALGIEESHFRRVLFRARERLQSLMEAT